MFYKSWYIVKCSIIRNTTVPILRILIGIQIKMSITIFIAPTVCEPNIISLVRKDIAYRVIGAIYNPAIT